MTTTRTPRRILLLLVAAIALTASPAAAAGAPAKKGVDTFTSMTGRVVRASTKKITIDFFPSGTTVAHGAQAYDAEVSLGLDSEAAITDKKGKRATKLNVYRTGDVVAVTGHVDPYTDTTTVCTMVNKVLSCSTRTEQKYRYWIDAIASKGGACAQSTKINVEVPWARNHDLRFLVCTNGAAGFVYLNRWDAIKSASVHLVFPDQTFDLEIFDGELSTFELSRPPAAKTYVKGTLTYDVQNDGRGAYAADLRRIRL